MQKLCWKTQLVTLSRNNILFENSMTKDRKILNKISNYETPQKTSYPVVLCDIIALFLFLRLLSRLLYISQRHSTNKL